MPSLHTLLRNRALVQALTPLRGCYPGSGAGADLISSNCPQTRRFKGKHVPSVPHQTIITASSSLARLLHTVVSPDSPHRLMVIQPVHKPGPYPYVPAESRLEEAESLVHSIEGWEVPHKRVDAVRKVHNQSFFGTGKTAELKCVVRQLGEELTGVFINTPTLTPTQHQTLQRLFRKEVFDRFGIVLRIFKERAQTREAKLQVELAEIPYTYNKLFGDAEERGRGHDVAGETPMVSRKLAMKKRLRRLQEELRDIRTKRRNLRENRAKRSATPTVAVVGYTNAGKTTLIKALTQDATMTPKDMLFATLDSTLHAGKLPCGLPVLYVDTIGFVSELPVELVESFAATLEDSISADILVHVLDGSHPQAYAQRANVVGVLERLDLRPHMLDNVINVMNKMDKVERGSSNEGGEDVRGSTGPTEGEEGHGGTDVLVSATCGTGLSELEMRVQREVLRATGQTFWIVELPTSGPHLSWLYSSDVTISCVQAADSDEERDEERLTVWVVFSEHTLGKFLSRFSGDDITLTPCQDHNFTMRTK